MEKIAVEFLVEPFVEGRPGPYVTAAIDALEGLGIPVTMDAFGSFAEGPTDLIAEGVGALIAAATRAGATRLQIQVHAEHPTDPVETA